MGCVFRGLLGVVLLPVGVVCAVVFVMLTVDIVKEIF